MRKKIKILIIVLSVLVAGSISITLGILYYIKAPSARFGHGMVYDDSINKVVLFGGGFQDSSSYTFYGDTWIYDPFANVWTEIFPQQSPSARSSHSMVYDSVNQKIILFGGIDLNDDWLDETWIFDSRLQNWNQVFPDNSPSTRGSSSFYYDIQAQKAILYGGYQEFGGHLDDTWAYDYSLNNWTNLNPSIKPIGRYGAPMVYDSINQRGFMFGGRTTSITDDNWVYYYANNSWTDLGLSSKPSNRYWQGLTYDIDAQKIIMFGGRIIALEEALDDTWTYDPQTNEWSEVSTTTTPTNRFHAPLVYAPESGKTIIFGGSRSPTICYGDTWGYSYNNNNWNLLK